MSGVTEDVDIFQIDDFTAVSDWEALVCVLEDAIQNELKVSRKSNESYTPVSEEEFRNGTWAINKCEIAQGNFKATLSHYQLELSKAKRLSQPEKQSIDEECNDGVQPDEVATEKVDESAVRFPVCYHDMSSSAFDFPRAHVHTIVRCFGVREFLVLEGSGGERRCAFATDESALRMTVSCARVALTNLECTLAFFLRTAEEWRNLFEGVCVSRHFATRFEMAHLHKLPPSCGSLAGAIQLFRERLATGMTCTGVSGDESVDRPPILVAVRYNFLVSAPLSSFVQLAQSRRATSVAEADFRVCFSTRSSVLEALHVSTVWPSLSELFAVDTEHYTELDPANAPAWTVAVQFRRPALLAGVFCSALRSLLHVADDTRQSAQNSAQSEDFHEQFEVLGTTTLQKLTAYLFDEHDSEIANETVPEEREEEETETEAETDTFTSQETRRWLTALASRLKTAPRGDSSSLLHRLAFVALYLATEAAAGRLEASLQNALRSVWRAFVLGLRSRFDNDYLIPAVEVGVPNTGYSILYQKLQKLNCCIAKRREQSLAALSRSAAKSRVVTSSETPTSKTAAENDDEFFECAETEEEVQQICSPEGRLHRCGDWRLRRTNEPLYVPETQEAAPLTEDEVAEQQRVLAALGTDERSREVRARMQCAQLLSDMQAFKAANPGAEFHDFLAWHSPRDLVPVRRTQDSEDDGSASGESMDAETTCSATVQYELSERMRQPGNVWIDTWQRAEACAACNQKRLFDETSEAEKLLHSLERVRLDSLVDEHLVPALLHSALVHMAVRDDPLLPRLRNSVVFLADQVAQATAQFCGPLADHESKLAVCNRPRKDRLLELIRKFEIIEIMITKRNELLQLFELARSETDPSDPLEPVLPAVLEPFVRDLLHFPDVSLNTTSDPSHATLINLLKRCVRTLRELSELDKADKEAEFMFTDKSDGTSGQAQPPKSKSLNDASFNSLLVKAVSREMILRTVLARPNALTSIPTPQRFYAYLSDDECRIAAAVTDDSIFT